MGLPHTTVVWEYYMVAGKVCQVNRSLWAGPVMDVEVLVHGNYVPAER